MIKIYNEDNMKINEYVGDGLIDLVYADFIYDNLDFSWVNICYPKLADQGIFIAQTDYRSVADLKIYLDNIFGKNNLVNWVIWSYDWGGRPKNAFGRKHDDILIYSKSDVYIFNRDSIKIPKKTAKVGAFNPSGRTHKIPTDVWEGNFHTMDKERVKDKNGKNIHWQKPLWLMDRLILAFTNRWDTVLDPFMGTGSTGLSCLLNDRHFIGFELDPDIYEIAAGRVSNLALR